MADYSKGFKRRVVQLWIQHGMSTNEISRTSGIDHKTLMKWYKRFYPEITEGTEKHTIFILTLIKKKKSIRVFMILVDFLLDKI